MSVALALITVIGCYIKGTMTLQILLWASGIFLVIAIIGAFSTKYADEGEELSFFR